MGEGNKHVVFGANGPLGRAVVKVLQGRSLPVIAVSRSGGGGQGAGVDTAAVDARNAEDVKRITADARVIYHCMNTPYSTWSKTHIPIMQGLIAGAKSSGAKLVYGDNLYAYAPQKDGNYHEGLKWEPVTRKGQIRKDLLNLLANESRTAGFPYTVGMASDFYGPYVLENGHLGALVIGRGIKGKSAQIVANPDLLHTFTFINDMAEDLVTLATDDRANGQTWHVRNAPPQSFREIIRLLGKLLDQNIKIQTLPKPLLRVAGWFNKDIAEVQEMLYQFHNPFVISDNKFRQTFGGQATSLEAGLQETIEWYKKQEGK